MASAFGRNFKTLREREGMTQNQMADELGFTQTTIWSWEAKSQPPRTSTLKIICDRFGVSEEDLLSQTAGLYAQQVGNLDAIAPERSNTYAPVVGSIAAGSPNDAWELNGERHWVNPDILSAYPDGFFLRVSGDSMDRILPDGCFVFISPDNVNSGDIAAVKVNGDEATIKRVKLLDGIVVLEPESSNHTHRRIVIDSQDIDAPEVRLLGRVVWFDGTL